MRFAFLLGMGGSWVSVSVISEATGYSGTAIRAAVRDMALGRLIRETENRPARYFVPAKPWAELLEISPYASPHRDDLAMPPWRFWSDIFGFLLSVVDWSERAIGSEGALEVVAPEPATSYWIAPTPSIRMGYRCPTRGGIAGRSFFSGSGIRSGY